MPTTEIAWFEDAAKVAKLGRWLLDVRHVSIIFPRYHSASADALQDYYDHPEDWNNEWEQMHGRSLFLCCEFCHAKSFFTGTDHADTLANARAAGWAHHDVFDRDGSCMAACGKPSCQEQWKDF